MNPYLECGAFSNPIPQEDQYYNHRALKRRDLIVELTFLLCVAMQAYVAVKSVAFYYAPHQTLRTVLLLGCSVICINAQSIYLRSWVASCTVRTGVLRRDFHAHELQFHDRVVGHVCDMCGLRLVAGAKGLRFGGFRCKTCDFDCCMRCFCRKDRNTVGLYKLRIYFYPKLESAWFQSLCL